MKIIRYFPAFFDVDDADRVEVEFRTLDELLAIPWVASWKEPIKGSDPFLRYSISPGPGDTHLMAEFRKGWFGKRSWYVVGRIPVDILYHDPYVFIGLKTFKS